MRPTWKLPTKGTPAHPWALREVVLEYEGPQVTIVDGPGGIYVSVATDADDELIRWLRAPISTVEYKALFAGAVSLRDCIRRGQIYVVDESHDGEAVEQFRISCEELTEADLPTAESYLPSDVFKSVEIDGQVDALGLAGLDVKSPSKRTIRTNLIFKGEPVVGSRGVKSSFAMKATEAYVDAISALGAARKGGPRHTEVFIVGTVAGSFGFELEEIQDFGDAPVDSISQQETTSHELLQNMLGLGKISDELPASLDPKAVASVRGFLKVLSKANAFCTIESEDSIVKFDSVVAVENSQQFLPVSPERPARVPTEIERIGQFLGLLPDSGSFEFQMEDGSIIRGKVPKTVEKSESINLHLEEPTRVTFKVTSKSKGEPKYSVLKLPEWIESNRLGSDRSRHVLKSGEYCPQSAVWRIYGRRNSERTFFEGDRFPKYEGEDVWWVYNEEPPEELATERVTIRQ